MEKIEKKIKILIADDSMLVREGLKNVIDFLDCGTVIGEAEDGLEILKMVEKHESDLIIMDIKMPHLNGVQATITMLAKRPDLKIFILSSYSDEEYLHDLLNVGVRGYGLKDIGLEEFGLAIKLIMNGNIYLAKELQSKIQNVYLSSSKSNIILTNNEIDLLKYLQKGYSTKKIANLTHKDKKTIDNYRSRLLKKTGAKNSVELISFAILNKLI
jgi:two-component system, NarL family, response regulator DegU